MKFSMRMSAVDASSTEDLPLQSGKGLSSCTSKGGSSDRSLCASFTGMNRSPVPALLGTADETIPELEKLIIAKKLGEFMDSMIPANKALHPNRTSRVKTGDARQSEG